ncbi:hypothetical protein E2L06_17930 [Haloterrigena sp. H1]|uniref:hypothetical protein n=1 Tax=Haloterrigena sp. H1 TaxID=2552943 RepID=UPI00110E932E|nr:hypothetical protein [Haloterrigena sp. H1]TMT77889.1 hypothetical protein E2L06_21100 [Haloterrigena sp. H1]TMT81782.1 hypothetical protein E2L06_17930 [Haloterrigena sp. H1]
MNRRTLLTTLGVLSVSGFAGCSQFRNDDAPAGSLQFENRDNFPHNIGISLIDIGAESETTADGYTVSGNVTVPPQQRTLTATSSMDPGETQTFENIFTESVYYLVEFTLDSTTPGENSRVPFNPSPSEREYYTVAGVVDSFGEISRVVRATDNPGMFEQ